MSETMSLRATGRAGADGPAVRRALLAATALLAVCGCTTRGGPIPYENPSFGVPDAPPAETLAYDWPLGPLDVVRVAVFQVPDLSGEFQVDARGNLDLPLIGSLSVRDEKPQDLAERLEMLYGRRYLNNPDVTVRLVSSNSQTATVEGGVRQPRVIPLQGKTTLLTAIVLAGGIDDQTANPRRVAIFRKREGRTVAAAFDLKSIRRGEMEDPLVYPGDTIIVESNHLRGLYRDLLQTIPVFAIFNPL